MNKPIRVKYGKIHCSTIEGKPRWRKLDQDFIIRVFMSDGPCRIELMKKDFEWDCSSVPWGFRWLVPVVAGSLEASCGHDPGCKKALRLKDRKLRKYYDDVYKLCIEYKGYLNGIQRFVAYSGVRIGALWNIISGQM